MKEFNRFLLLGFVLLLIAGCSKMEIEPDPLYSGDHTALKGAKVELVPFKGAFDTWGVSEGYIFHPDGYPIGVHVVVAGSGNSSHLGKTTMIVDQQWYFPATSGPLTGTSVITLTAANGDELLINFTGEMAGNENFTYIEIRGSGSINGGSGRFTDAEGTIELVATYEKFAPGVIDGEGETFMTGTIIY
jgi:hypothetical protein